LAADPEIIGSAGAGGGIIGYLVAWLINKNKVNTDTCNAIHKGIDQRFDSLEEWLKKIDGKVDRLIEK